MPTLPSPQTKKNMNEFKTKTTNIKNEFNRNCRRTIELKNECRGHVLWLFLVFAPRMSEIHVLIRFCPNRIMGLQPGSFHKGLQWQPHSFAGSMGTKSTVLRAYGDELMVFVTFLLLPFLGQCEC